MTKKNDEIEDLKRRLEELERIVLVWPKKED